MSELPVSPVSGAGVYAYPEAFQSVLGEIRGLPKEQVQPCNLEIPLAATIVLGSLPEITPLRGRVLAELPTFPIDRFDKLETYTAAMAHAHTLYMAASRPPEPVTELVEQCSQMRELLLSDAQALAKRGIIDGSRLKDLKGNNSYRYTAFDVFTLVQILTDNRQKIQGKTAVEPAELQRAQQLAQTLTRALGEREQAPAALEAATSDRDRAFTLFIKAYNDVQRAVSYLEPQRADEIAPTVYVGGRAARKKPLPPDPAGTEVTPDPPTAPGGPGGVPASAVPDSPARAIAPGLPGASPFVRG
jgi:hypothetical protein